MPALDFNLIRATPKSQRDSFEALTTVLFRLTNEVPDDAEFVSLRGDGGDGGVEAYIRNSANKYIGLQAKFLFTLGASEFSQIKGSLGTALENYPGLIEYHIYVPFDLTGEVARGRRGKSEIRRFNEWRNEVEARQRSLGQPLRIVLVSASDIRRQLLRVDTYGGLRRYWFTDSLLTHHQIENGIDAARAFAGPRYSALLDVVTDAHRALDFFGRIDSVDDWAKGALAPIRTKFSNLASHTEPIFSVLGDKAKEGEALFVQLMKEVREALANGKFEARLGMIESTASELLPLVESAEKLHYKQFCGDHGQENDTPGFRQWQAEYMVSFPAASLDFSRDAAKVVTALLELLRGATVRAGVARSLLLIGPAGVGKTHALVSAAERRLKNGAYSLLVFGDDFRGSEPWEVIRAKLGLSASIGRSELFECLSACANATDYPFVIYIDALNESPDSQRWKSKLPELLTELVPYPEILVCVSTRDTYASLVVDERFPGYAFTHRGFEGREAEALEAFCAAYEIQSDIAPLFAAEVANPLFLHLACKTIKATGETSLDLTRSGFAALFEAYLQLCDKNIRGRLGYVAPGNQVRAALRELTAARIRYQSESIDWDVASAAVTTVLGAEVSPAKMLEELRREGLVIVSEAALDQWTVRLAFQRFGDTLYAVDVIEQCRAGGALDVAALKARISVLGLAELGVLEAIAAVLPEEAGIEITDPSLGLGEESYELLVKSLVWRSRSSVSAATASAVEEALSVKDLWRQVYEAVFRLSMLPDYALNAEWLSSHLLRRRLPERDTFLSLFAYESYDQGGVVKSIIEAGLRAQVSRWEKESLWLAAVDLVWLTSCADRRVRDQATKGLMRLVSICPELVVRLAELVEVCNDDYILESLALAAYCACTLSPEKSTQFLPALDALAQPSFRVANICVRDAVRMLAGEVGLRTEIPEELSVRIRAFAEPFSLPPTWPTDVDAEALTSIEKLPSSMELRSGIGTDFWRYVVQSKLRGFDLQGSGISQENISAWIMTETLRLGYPGAASLALKYDRMILGTFGNGRGRSGYAERLGKKYYWIALHRLVGIVCKNIPAKSTYYDEPEPDENYFYSLHLRKVDITDIRDISDEQTYPSKVLGSARYPFEGQPRDDAAWVLADDISSDEVNVLRDAADGAQWVALSFSANDDNHDEDDRLWSSDHRYLRLYYSSAIAPYSYTIRDKSRIPDYVFDSSGNHCYRAFVAEYPRSAAFKQCVEFGDVSLKQGKLKYTEVELLRGSEWEYDYASTSRQENLPMPCPELIEHLQLTWDRQSGWNEGNGGLAAFYIAGDHRHGLYIRRDLLDSYLRTTRQVLIFRRFLNRGKMTAKHDGPSIDVNAYLRYDGSGLSLLYENADPINM
ncbi:ATP-binding protein [Cupriavidus pauculus]|uniref:ATP-binding protein n=1 Tax=Cupriavidus pauculus TaxID=82633 RepID=UPI0012FE3BE2|nr:ATP-binding protein [Cupriavidus pauculus]